MVRPTATRSGRAAFLATRFGRRLFAVFVGAALLPIAMVALLSFRSVSGELLEQADVRLHRAARAAGMVLAGRLFALADPASGGFLAPPGEGEESRRLEVVHEGRGPARIFLHTGKEGGPQRREIPRDEVFADLETLVLPDRGEYVVLSEGQVVASSFPGALALPPAWRSRPPARERVTWSHGDVTYLGRARELFLRASLSAPPWTVVVLEPRDEVVAPVVAFRNALLAAVALTLLAVPLFALRQIRQRLVPLERLREGADRIGAGDLEARVPVTGDDELAEVGRAFNRMGEDLDRHFRALDTLLEIDREIVAAEDAPVLAAVVARGAFALERCDAVAVAFAEEGDPEGPSGWLAEGPGGELRRVPGPTAPEAAAWSGWTPVDRPLGAKETGVVGPLAAAGVRFLRVVPLAAGGVPLGALLLGRRERAFGAPDPVAYVRQLADQASTALSHLRERERRRALAYFDSATGLPNRFMFRERLQQALRAERPDAAPMAVAVLAVEGISRVLETLGHSASQAVLQAVADRLGRAHAAGVFRLDRSEFAVLLPELESSEAAARAVRRLLDTLALPFPGGPEEVTLAAYAGVAVHPQDGADEEVLERNARAALGAARSGGGDPYRFYSPEMNRSARARLSMEAELRRALRREELHLAYQPIFDARDRSLLGAEALARWSRDGEPVSPGLFVPLAEEAGLVGELGQWALRTACRDLAAWLRIAPDLDVHVNVSPLQLRDGALPAVVRGCLFESGVPGRALTLEITESTLTDQGEATRSLLRALERLGVHLAIDDFGTGYSSLAQLRSLPAQVLKIDRCFVERLPDDPGDVALVRAVVDLAHGRGMRVVAEGVETEGQLAFLGEIGCDAAQGFLLAEPMPADAFRKRIEEAATRGSLAG